MDISFMRIAIAEAKKGEGHTNPNPLVGAVIVKNNRIIAIGYHKCYGDLHAECDALKNATEDVRGADMYVTLEPCSHYGKQPPCVKAIVEAGIKRVFIGSEDPNPLVNGKGVEYLKSHGTEVFTGVLKDECDELNDIFFHFIKKHRPYVIMKTAMTADGKIATYTGKSKWITNEKSRENAQLTRKRVAVIMVGINTVLEDNPMLNCRCDDNKTLVRVICDSNLRIPSDSNIVKTAKNIPTVIATVSDDNDKISELQSKGLDIIKTSGDKINLYELMNELGNRKLDSILLEGGATLNYSMLEADLVDELHLYIAPKMFGGDCAKTPVGGNGVSNVADAFRFGITDIQTFGNDILIKYKRER